MYDKLKLAKVTQRFKEVHPIMATSSVCVVSRLYYIKGVQNTLTIE